MCDQAKVVDGVQRLGFPRGPLRRLDGRGVTRSATVALEVDAARECPSDDVCGGAGVDPAEVDSGREHENVRCKPMPP